MMAERGENLLPPYVPMTGLLVNVNLGKGTGGAIAGKGKVPACDMLIVCDGNVG